jgi:hypothetical protein
MSVDKSPLGLLFFLFCYMEYFRLFIRMSTMLNPDFPFEYIACEPYIEEIVVHKNEVNSYSNVVKTEQATELDWTRYQRKNFW